MEIKVLLSTFNGEKYIQEQLDSILSQKIDNDKINLIIRDDGSSDGTEKILRKYMNIYPDIIQVYFENNIGWMNSFIRLLYLAGPADYYAYCDQDDIWKDDKLKRAINMLCEANGPALYCGAAEMVDDNMKIIGVFGCDSTFDIVNTIIKCQTIGCTQVFNAKLFDYVKKIPPMQDIPHDWWTVCVALLVGTVWSDGESHMFYRQHSANVFGGKGAWYKRVKRIISDKSHKREKLSRVLLENLHVDNVFLGAISEYRYDKQKKKYLLKLKNDNVPFFNNIFFKVFILFNKI